MARLMSFGAITVTVIFVLTGIATLAPANGRAQSTDMSERVAARQLEQRLDSVRRQAARMEKVVVKGWDPVSKKKEDRYRNETHKKLDELQKKARSEKRRLNSGASEMIASSRERYVDYRDLEYTVQQMENETRALQKQVDKIEERQRAADD